MKIVHFLTNKGRVEDYFITPVRYNKKALYERGYKVSVFYKPSEKCISCDILCLVSKAVLQMLKEINAVIREPSPVLSFIKKARSYADKMIWMDTSDSTGVTHFELLPYVDLYLKKQLLKDKTLYQREFYGGRIFTEFYHREFGIVDTNPFKQFYPLDMNLAHKVGLSWNIGIGDMYNPFSKKGAIRLRFADFLPVSYKIGFVDPAGKRDMDIFLRTSSNLEREVVAFHRKELIKRLDRVSKNNPALNVSLQGKRLSLKDFRGMMKNSKILPSPFGWGELGVRDYEVFIFGALLLKPDIRHMETWPPIFIEGETYQPFRWDFEDLESVILDMLQSEKKRIHIAVNGQEAYRASISSAGMERFCDWFIQQIEK